MAKANQDAIALLKADHRAVEELFDKFSNTTASSEQQKLARRICTELIIHTMIEEEVFYPSLRGKIEDDTLDEAYVEHDGAKMMIAQILAGVPKDEFFIAKVTVLSEEIKHHVREEEMPEGMFAQARKTDVDLDALGRRLADRKLELKSQFEAKGLPSPTTRTMTPSKIEMGQPLNA